MSETTPKKQREIVFGSPAALKKPVPHVVFLILSKSIETSHALIRILLNFYINVNPEFTWGFEFVGGLKLAGRKLQSARQALNLSMESITKFRKATRSFNKQPWSTAIFAEYIQQIMIQCQWNTGPVIPFQSPVKVAENVASIKVRNYLFVLGELPAELQPNSSTNYGNDADNFNKIACEFTKSIPWEKLAQTRISLYWVNTVNSESNSTNIEWWFANLLKYLGGGLITKEALFSVNFKKYWKRICIKNVEMHLLKQMVNSELPLNLISKNPSFLGAGRFHVKISVRNELRLPKNIDFKSMETEICSRIPFELSNNEFSVIGFGTDLEFDKYEGLSFIVCPFLFNAEYLGKNQRTLILSNISFENDLFVLKFYGMSGVAEVKQIQKEYVSFETEYQELEYYSPLANSDIWLYSNELPNYLEQFLKEGVINPNYSEEIAKDFLGLWEPCEPKPSVFSPKSEREENILELPEENICNEDEDLKILQPYSTLQELFTVFTLAYNEVLFKKHTHLDFVQKIIPEAYVGVTSFCEAEGIDPVTHINQISELMDFYMNTLIVSTSEIDQKHKNLSTQLSFLIDNKVNQPTELPLTLVKTWFSKEKSLYTHKEFTEDPCLVFKESIGKLKTQEALLQIIIYLECLRISIDSAIKLPFKELVKNKRFSKKKDMKLQLRHGIKFLVDKILIWNVNDESSVNELKEFSEIVIHQFYTESLPTVSSEISKKFEPAADIIEIPELTTPKKPKPKKYIEKPKVAELKRAPTRIQQIRRRELAINPKKKKRRVLHDKEIENTIPEPQAKIMNIEQVLVPETPAKYYMFNKIDGSKSMSSDTNEKY